MLVVPAHAKVNLALEVTGRRPDGWHEVATVIATVDWHDLVGLAVRRPRATARPPAITLRVSGPFAEGVPGDESNLAVRAARALLHLAGDPRLDVDLWVCKQVPAAAGLGGGSADAAAVLRAGATLLQGQATTRPITPEALQEAGAELGSDVPALLAGGGTTLATGRGELLTPLPTPRLHLAIAVAGPSATAAAYAALSDDERQGDGRAHRLADALRTPPPGNAVHQPEHRLPEDQLGSALEPGACRAAPGLADALRRLRALTPAHPWHLTGSGGGAFATAPDAATAARLAEAAAAAGFVARACRTIP
jgi:4-diphosphocytidyl-2-C-methyl-D-erythritol kinase